MRSDGLGKTAAVQDGFFKGRHVTSEVILWALRWYLAFPVSYRDLAWPCQVGGLGRAVAAWGEHANLWG